MTRVARGLAKAVVGQHRSQRPGHAIRGDQIASPDVSRVESECRGCHVDQPLTHKTALEAPRAAQRTRRGFVAHPGVGIQFDRLDLIRSGEELRRVAHRGHAIGAHIGTDIDMQRTAHGQNAAGGIKCHRHVRLGFTRVPRGHEMLATILDPFDRAIEAAGRKGEQKILGIELTASTEPATDVIFNVIDCSFVEIHERGQRAAIEPGHFGRTVHGQVRARAVPPRNQTAGLHRCGSHALHSEAIRLHMSGGAEGSIHCALTSLEHHGAVCLRSGKE